MPIKPGISWFPAPMQWHHLMTDVSDGAFKLFVYLCFNADRNTAQYAFRQTALAKSIGKSRRSLTSYLKELQDRQICIVNMSSNQYTGGTIQIQDAYWPYEGSPPTASLDRQERDSYFETIKAYLQPRACVRCRFSSLDRQLAKQWSDDGVDLQTIEKAFLLACSRKYVSWLNGAKPQPIGSLRYFEKILEEVIQDSSAPEYWDFLKTQLNRLEQKWTSPSSNSACANFSQAKTKIR